MPKRPKKAQKHFFLSDYSITPLKRFLVTPEIHPGPNKKKHKKYQHLGKVSNLEGYLWK